MNLAALKTFAPQVRRQLLEAVGRKLDYVLSADTADLRAAAPQVELLRSQAVANRTALIERVTYTWFNRLAALRFLDARGWHPFRARVITAAGADETQPELLRLTRAGNLPAELAPFTDPERLNDLLDGHLPSTDPQGEVYRYLLLAACRFYHNLMPFLFEALDDETELLLPDDLLTEHSIAHGFRTEISEEDCGAVELLGWLYQFYISEKKDQVMARKSAVPSEDIPAVTQLFTPHWIVRYLVENSLGRLWLLNRPGSRLREQMPYYIEGEPETDFLKITKPEEIRLCDPAVGSGHMLTYAFDLLTLIYEEEGYAPSEIPALILGHNLYGLDICPRAAQLAELALVFKAREKSRRFFQSEHIVQPIIIELQDVRFAEDELRDYSHALGLDDLFNPSMLKLLHQFEEAKNFGSLIQPCLDERAIATARRAIEAKDLGGQLFLRETHLKVLHILEQAEALTHQYHVVVANPPYMGSIQLNGLLGRFVSANFSEGSQDLYGAFIMRNLEAVVPKGLVAMITFQNWLSASSFRALREYLINHSSITSLVHNGRGVWGADFGSCAFVLGKDANQVGSFYRLFEKISIVANNEELNAKFLATTTSPTARIGMREFAKIPGSSIIYWASAQVISIFQDSKRLGDVAQFKAGMSTGNNPIFQRNWFEIEERRFAHPCSGSSGRSDKRWFPCNSGGNFRKWYGNDETVVDWGNGGALIKRYNGSAVRNEGYYFRDGLTYNKISIGRFAARYRGAGYVFDDTGRCVFPSGKETNIYSILAFLCSAVADHFLKMLTPTVSFTSKELEAAPWRSRGGDDASEFSKECISLARADWDNFETSWDFRDQPFLRPGLKGATLEASWRNWETQSTAAIRRMQELETENNRLFIAAYGLEDELQPEVPEAQITLARAEVRRDMAAFLSYAIGCMMGRYSLDHPGLILANAGDTLREFLSKVERPQEQLTFAPDEDGIIPILDGEWFEDDIVARTRDFLRATFGETTLEANLRFIEESLGKDLRKYFLTDFYKDHLQTYKKRPIYWLFQSPKKGFNALVYLHRYTKDTPNRVLSGYLREFLHKLRTRQEYLAHIMISEATPPREITKARKESEQNAKTIRECEEYEREVLLPLAQRRIELDLDDGVKVNYLKLGAALAPIPGLATQED